jgi:hypothetical protein
MRHKHGKFFRNRSVMKGTLLESTEQFFDSISPRIQAGWPKRHIWKPLPMRCNDWKFTWNRLVTKVTLLVNTKHFRLQLTLHSSPMIEASYLEVTMHVLQSWKVSSKSVSNEGHFTQEHERVFHLFLPRIQARWPKRHICKSLHMCCTQCNFGPHQSEMKNTLLRKAKQFFIAITTRIQAGWSNVISGSLYTCAATRGNLAKIGG